MQEAMDMTPEEFDQAAHRLLQAEQHGTLEFPVPGSEAGGARGRGGGGAGRGEAAARWDEDDFDDETQPLRSPTSGGPAAPTRKPRGGQGGRPGSGRSRNKDTNV